MNKEKQICKCGNPNCILNKVLEEEEQTIDFFYERGFWLWTFLISWVSFIQISNGDKSGIGFWLFMMVTLVLYFNHKKIK